MYEDKGKPRLDDMTKAAGLVADWSRNLPRLAGHVAWLAHGQLLAAREAQRGAVTLAYLEATGLHRLDPHPRRRGR